MDLEDSAPLVQKLSELGQPPKWIAEAVLAWYRMTNGVRQAILVADKELANEIVKCFLEEEAVSAAEQEEACKAILAELDELADTVKSVCGLMWAMATERLLLRGSSTTGSGSGSQSSSSSHASSSQQQFRNRVISFYHDADGNMVECMVLKKLLPKEYVTTGHVFQRRLNAGVRWNSAVAEAYEQQQVCFSDGGLPHKYLLHVLDAELMTTKLASVGRHKDDPKFAEAMGDTTFGQLHDGELDLSGPDGQGPCKSALALHAMLALESHKGNFPDGFKPEDYNFDCASEDADKHDRVSTWLGQQQAATGAEAAATDAEAAATDAEAVATDVEAAA